MSNKIITIIDYGISNLFSVKNAIIRCGFEVEITSDPFKVLNAKSLILPGVGAFNNGIKELENKKLIDPIKTYIELGKPILGICLGMQLFASFSHEFGKHKGLDLIEGEVVPIPKKNKFGEQCIIPNIGWTKLIKSKYCTDNHFLFKNLKPDSEVYLVHSFHFEPIRKSLILSYCNFSDHKLCIAINKKNIYGVQFHPEKSGEVGLKILKNFCDISFNS